MAGRYDNVIYRYQNGKFRRTSNKIKTTANHNNFLIICVYGDWSGFRTLEGCERQFPDLENSRPDGYFEVVERL